MRRPHARVLLVLLTAVAIVPRALAALRDALWFDEVNTLYRAAGDGLAGVLARVAQDVQAPLYDVLVHALSLVMPAPAALRLPAVVAGVLLVPAVHGLARRLRQGRLVALLAAAWVALQPLCVRMGSEGRPYALLALLAALAWDAAVRVRRSGGRRGLSRLAVTTTLLALSHYYGVVAVLAIAVVLLLSLERVGPGLPRVVAALSVPLVALVAWSPAALYQFHLKEMNALYRPLFSWDTAAELLDAHGWFGGARPLAPAIASRVALVALLGLGLAVSRRRARAAPPPARPAASCARPALGLVVLGGLLLAAAAPPARDAIAALASDVYKGGRPLDADNLAFLARARALLCAEGLLVLLLAGLVAALPALARRPGSRLRPRGLLLVGLLVPLLATAVVEAAGRHTLMTRNTIVLAPLVAIAGARGLAALGGRARASVVAGLAALVLVPAADGSVSQPRPDWRAVVELVERAGAEPVAYPPWLARCLDHHRGLPFGTSFGSWHPEAIVAWARGRPLVTLVRSFEPLHPPHAVRAALVSAFGPPVAHERIGRITCETFATTASPPGR